MAAPLVTWRKSANYVHPSSVSYSQDKMTAWRDAVNANVAANPATAIWEVAASSISSVTGSVNYLTLRRRSGAAGRIMFFGTAGNSVLPSVWAVDGTMATAAAGTLYLGYASSPTGLPSDTPDVPPVLYTTEQPYPYWCRGMNMSIYNGEDYRLFNYIESEAGILFMPKDTSEVGNLARSAGAGDIVVDLADNARPAVFSSGNLTGYNSTFDVGASGIGLLPRPDTYGYFDCGLYQRDASRWSGIQCYRSVAPFNVAGAQDRMYSEDLSQRYYLPIMIMKAGIGVNARGIAGRMRQIAYGAYGMRGQEILEAGTGAKMATCWSGSTQASVPALWCTEFAM